MSINNFDELYKHYGHSIVVARYEDITNEPINVSIECEDCYEVLLDYEREGK